MEEEGGGRNEQGGTRILQLQISLVDLALARSDPRCLRTSYLAELPGCICEDAVGGWGWRRRCGPHASHPAHAGMAAVKRRGGRRRELGCEQPAWKIHDGRAPVP